MYTPVCIFFLLLSIIYEHNNAAMGFLFICFTVDFATNRKCYLVNIYS